MKLDCISRNDVPVHKFRDELVTNLSLRYQICLKLSTALTPESQGLGFKSNTWMLPIIITRTKPILEVMRTV